MSSSPLALSVIIAAWSPRCYHHPPHPSLSLPPSHHHSCPHIWPVTIASSFEHHPSPCPPLSPLPQPDTHLLAARKHVDTPKTNGCRRAHTRIIWSVPPWNCLLQGLLCTKALEMFPNRQATLLSLIVDQIWGGGKSSHLGWEAPCPCTRSPNANKKKKKQSTFRWTKCFTYIILLPLEDSDPNSLGCTVFDWQQSRVKI